MTKRFTAVVVLAMLGCGGEVGRSGLESGDPKIPTALSAVLGDYSITANATMSNAGGWTMRLAPGASPATLSLRASRPGVMGVPNGMTIPGITPSDIIYGAAYVQNPVHVFMGTTTQDQHGDFGIWSSVWIGLPPNPVHLEYVGCEGEGVFGCSPVFFQSADVTDQVNLVYFAVSVTGARNGDITISGYLSDTHKSEAAATNGFAVRVTDAILGQFVDQYIFYEGATFTLTIQGTHISGVVEGVGRSAALIGHPDVNFRMTFDGDKAP